MIAVCDKYNQWWEIDKINYFPGEVSFESNGFIIDEIKGLQICDTKVFFKDFTIKKLPGVTENYFYDSFDTDWPDHAVIFEHLFEFKTLSVCKIKEIPVDEEPVAVEPVPLISESMEPDPNWASKITCTTPGPSLPSLGC